MEKEQSIISFIFMIIGIIVIYQCIRDYAECGKIDIISLGDVCKQQEQPTSNPSEKGSN